MIYTSEAIQAKFGPEGNATEADYQALENVLGRNYRLSAYDLETEEGESLYFYSDIPESVLTEGIDGWYSDGESWLLSVATTTRNQPLYGIDSIRDGWLEASRSDRPFESYEFDGYYWENKAGNQLESDGNDRYVDDDGEELTDKQIEDMGYEKKYCYTMAQVYSELVRMCDKCFEHAGFPRDCIADVEEHMNIHASSGIITLQY